VRLRRAFDRIVEGEISDAREEHEPITIKITRLAAVFLLVSLSAGDLAWESEARLFVVAFLLGDFPVLVAEELFPVDEETVERRKHFNTRFLSLSTIFLLFFTFAFEDSFCHRFKPEHTHTQPHE
jgi:hypothetical protein